MNQEVEKLGKFPYIVASLSFIPMLGVPLGVVCLVFGLLTKKQGGKKVALIGTAGILVSVGIYGSLYYFSAIKRGGTYDELRTKLAQTTIVELAKGIEFYKLNNGHYPKDLETYQATLPESTFITIYDPTGINRGEAEATYYYELSGDKYYLLSVGLDKVPFTSDDIVPLFNSATNNTGLLIHKGSQSGL